MYIDKVFKGILYTLEWILTNISTSRPSTRRSHSLLRGKLNPDEQLLRHFLPVSTRFSGGKSLRADSRIGWWGSAGRWSPPPSCYSAWLPGSFTLGLFPAPSVHDLLLLFLFFWSSSSSGGPALSFTVHAALKKQKLAPSEARARSTDLMLDSNPTPTKPLVSGGFLSCTSHGARWWLWLWWTHALWSLRWLIGLWHRTGG